jgi:hypothetical protein
MSTDPVSPYRRTLAQRGGGIACCCILLILCAVVHMLSYGVLAFTDLSETTLEAPVDAPPPLIVTADGTPTEEPEATASASPVITGEEMADVNTVRSQYGVMIENAVNISRGVGFIATLLLIGQLLLATVVAGQANLIGLPRVASAATGSFLVGIIVVPWGELFPALGYPGAFVTFAHIEGSLAPEGIMAQVAAYGTTIAIPGAVLLLSAIIALRYRIALDEGLSVPDEDEDDAFDPTAAIAAVRAAKSEASSSGTADESPAPLQAVEEEEPPEQAVNRPLMTSSSSLDDDTQSMLHRSARKPRSRRKTRDDDDDRPKPPGDEDTRRATQVGSTEPLRRPI